VSEGSGKALEEALRLASMGIALVPIDPVEKKPFYDLLPKDEEGDRRWWPLRETPATPEQIEWWFWGGSDCNIAIITGQPSGLAVLDIDGPTPPDLHLPDTVVEKTPREEGGYHHYFSIDGAQGSGNYRWTDGDIEYRCELKADGRYVICAPSSFGARPYEWLPGHSIFEREPAPLPPGLVEYLEGKHGKETSKRRESRAARSGQTSTRKPARGSRDLRWYEELRYDEDVAVKIMRKCGADVVAVGDSFLCPLPGHEERH
jgi:Bifunctional DNA primase/polymerase, N-terminal